MKKFLSLLSIAALAAAIFCLLPMTAFASEVTGTCGENVSYSYDTDTKVLTVFVTDPDAGDGVITDYAVRKSPFYTNTTIRNNCTSIVVGEGVTVIGSYTFFFLGQVTTISLPSTLTEIHDYAFATMNSCTSCDIPEGVVSIGASAFNNMKQMTGLTLPSTLTSIGKQAFNGWYQVAELEIPASVRTIGESAFSGWTGLTSLTFNEGLESIGRTAFGSCQVTELHIPATVTEIGYDAFSGFNDLTAYTVAENSESFCAVDGILYSKDKSVLIDCPLGKAGAVEIDPACAEIATHAFYECSQVTSITIPESVTTIRDSAFGKTGITEIVIPASVTTMEISPFEYCESLTTVVMNASVSTLPQNCFYYCTALTDVTINSNITSLEPGVFNGCSSLVSVDLPDTLTAIPDNCFYCCSSLASVEIPETVISIGSSAFYGCSSLDHLELPEGLKTIGGSAFSGNYSNPGCPFTELVLPEGLTSIGSGAFNQCQQLVSIVLPENIVEIPSTLFSGCVSLKTVEVMGDINLCPGQFFINSSSFNNCTSLQRIIFHCACPTNKTINSYAFSGVTTKNVEICFPAQYTEWAKLKPLDVGSYTFIYKGCYFETAVFSVGVELRERTDSDAIHDVRFIFRVGTPEGTTIKRRYVEITCIDTGAVMTIKCPVDYAQNEDGSVEFTAVLVGIKNRYNSVQLQAQAFVVYTGAESGTAQSEPVTTSVNELLMSE